MTTTYSDEQKEVLRSLMDFSSRDTHKVFVMSGYAGTGKTHLLGDFVKRITKTGRIVRLLAPTGRAARIISLKTSFDASTIHRVIYQHSEEGMGSKEENYYVRFSLKSNIDPDNTIYVIDESSMISDKEDRDEILQFGSGRLLCDLMDYVRPNETGRKIIFSGDSAQLEPLRMNFSPALDPDYLTQTYSLPVTAGHLTRVYRQKESSSVLACATKLRDQLKMEKPDEVVIAADGKQIHQKPLAYDFDRYKKSIIEEEIPSSVWICYRNKDVDHVNREMRLRLSYFPERVRAGEILIVAANNYRHETLFMNGDQLRVIEVSDWVENREVVFNYKEQRGIREVLSFRDVVVQPFNRPEERHSVKMLDNSLLEHDMTRLRIALYVDLVNRHKKKPDIPFDMAKKSDPYYNSLITKYGYAMTCHKAQGGEWGHVYLDLYHNSPPHTRSFIRWAYTGLTRSSGTVHLHNPVCYRARSAYIIEPVELLHRQRNLVPAYESLPVTEHDPPEVQAYPFLKAPLTAIENITKQEDLKFVVRHFPYKVRLFFDNGLHHCTLDIGYKKKGLKSEIQLIETTSPDFENEMRKILDEVLQGRGYVFQPEETWRNEFHEALKGYCMQAAVTITNVYENLYCDTYILDTDQKGSELNCYYDSLGRYTKIQPKSTSSEKDEKLNELIRLLKT